MIHFRNILLFILLISISQTAYNQNIDVFSSVYYPSNPFGGKEQLQEFVKQEIVYPQSAIDNGIEGEVHITYLIDYKGKVVFKEIALEANQLLKNEAERIFDKILWESDKERNTTNLGYEQIKFHFNIKKYKRLCKKRGYTQLPYGDYVINPSPNYFTINQIDEKPEIENGHSINEFISKNINYPPIAYQRDISGRVTVEFIVEPYGMASNFRIIEAVAGGCNEETIRLIKRIQWKPGIKNEKAVRTLFRYQLNFVHPGGTVR